MKFDYRTMSDWYNSSKDDSSLFENDQKMVAFFLLPSNKYKEYSDRALKKRKLAKLEKKQGYREAFVKPNIKVSDIRKIKFINSKFYPNGLYVVRQDDENIFFVFPIIKHANIADVDVIAADHYSLPLDNGFVNLHITSYIPNIADANIGEVSHLPGCRFKDGSKMPETGYDTNLFGAMGNAANDILDLCRKYNEKLGGGKGLAVPMKKQAAAPNEDILEKLCKKLVSKEINRADAFGYLFEGEWHVTCCLWRTREEDYDEHHYYFKIKKPHKGLFYKKLLSALE